VVVAGDTQVVRVVPIIPSILEGEAVVHTMQEPVKITVLGQTPDMEK
jgi:hypothetical protein